MKHYLFLVTSTREPGHTGMRVPGLPFKEEMAKKTLRLVTTSGDRAKA